MRRVEIHLIVAPVPRTGKFTHRHQFHGRNSEIFQVVEFRDNARESAFRSESADVQLVKDVIGEREALPIAIGPHERMRIDNLRRAVHAVRLRARNRIGALAAIFKNERIVVARFRIGNEQLEVFPMARHRKRRLIEELEG